MLLAGCVFSAAIAPAQETKVPVTTQQLLKKLEVQSQRSEKELQDAVSRADTSEASSMELIISRNPDMRRVRTRDLSAMSATTPPRINLELEPDATMRVRDANETTGLILTGKWIIDYAKMIKLVPEYEKTLASYKSQTGIQQQLITELEGIIGVKDKKIEILSEIAESQKQRAELFKTMAEIEKDPWYQKMLRKIAFPLGLTIGAYLGVKIADNN